MKDFDIFDHMDGIPDKESEKVRAQEVYKKVRNEFKKISKEDALGYSLQAVYIAHIIIDNECDCNEKVPPSYRLYANGTNDKDLQVILDKAIQKFIKEGNYFFHYYCHQLEREFPSILVLCRTKDKSFDEVQSNYKISIKFKHEIELENNSYKKIRKLLEMAKKNMSLLMNEDGKIYAMGKMIDNPSCEYYEISFDGFFKWTLYKNKEKLLCYENMIPMIPDKEIGISNKNLELLKRTFDISDTSKFEKIIQKAVSQKHGTIVVFAENAMDEASRFEESGISITPIDISTGMLVEEITSIDGALICDVDGICYSIGTILDGIKSERTDSSRGARYNSAIRYIEKQKKNQKKTFIVVVSEDGYVNCFSSEE